MALPEKNIQEIKEATYTLLVALGLDPQSEAFKDTPKRVADLYDDVLDGKFAKLHTITTFESIQYSGVIQVHHAPFYSWCAHHLLPMQGHFGVAYIPDGRFLGLSKIVRIFRHCCKIPTTQEEITQSAVNLLTEVAKPKGVICYVEAEHMCMTLRGVKSPGSITSTIAFKGVFERDSELREQFIAIASRKE